MNRNSSLKNLWCPDLVHLLQPEDGEEVPYHLPSIQNQSNLNYSPIRSGVTDFGSGRNPSCKLQMGLVESNRLSIFSSHFFTCSFRNNSPWQKVPKPLVKCHAYDLLQWLHFGTPQVLDEFGSQPE